MEYDPFDIEEIKVGQMNPDPERHDSIVVADKETGLIHELEELKVDAEDSDKIAFRARLSDAKGYLLDNVEGWIEKQPIAEAKEMKIWFKDHDKQVAGGAAATVLAVAVGSLVIRRRKRR